MGSSVGSRPTGLQAAVIAFSIRFRGVVIALGCLLLGYGAFSLLSAKYDRRLSARHRRHMRIRADRSTRTLGCETARPTGALLRALGWPGLSAWNARLPLYS